MTRQNFHKLIDCAESEVYKEICQSVADDHCFFEDNSGTLHILEYCECDKCPYKDQNDCCGSLTAYLMEGESEVII